MSSPVSQFIFRCLRAQRRQQFARATGGRSNNARRGRLNLDSLETRLVPAPLLVSEALSGTTSTAVEGTVYEDLDSNGIKNNGENGVSGWTVYLDLDQSGTLNTDAVGVLEPSTVTDKDGNYKINRLIPGAFRVSEVVPSGWTPTAPASLDVLVTNNQATTANFFNFSGGDIVGTVWDDLNADGIRATDPTTGDFTDPGLAAWTVFLDLNNDRKPDVGEPTTRTDPNGSYSFRNLPPDDYEVTVFLPDGWDNAPGFDNRQTVSVVAQTQKTQDYAVFSLLNGSIHGTIWNDSNIDGVRNTNPTTGAFTEPGVVDWQVFLDLNHNGVAEATEPATVTDANGNYSFISVAEGDYEVTEILPEGWDVSPTFDTKQTVSVLGGEASTGADFANFTITNGSIRGTIWNDTNRNGIRERNLAGTFTEPGLSGWTVFIDLNHNRLAEASEPTALTDANGGYSFGDLQVGDYDVLEVLPSGWETTAGFDDNSTVTVFSGIESLAPDFANFNLSTAIPGSLSGTVWNDRNGNGIRESAAGSFTDPGLAGWTVYVDLNKNGIWDTAEPKVDTATDGSYSFSNILPGSVTIRELVKSGWRATAPSTELRTISLRNGENASGLDFGNWTLQDSAIRGVVFADSNKNGVRDTGELGLAGLTVYVDTNNNGVLDTGEPRTETSADLFFTPDLDEAGTYRFTHLAEGTYTVRVVIPALLSATPLTESAHTVTLTTAEDRSDVNCAAVFRPTEIHGIKFDDRNGNHVQEADEHGVGGATIFVDLDRDEVVDADEPRTITNEDGSYSFSDLTPGAYVVREVVNPGYEATYPTTTGGILWPQGVSNPAVGNVSPTSITTSLSVGETYPQTVSITLPITGALTNLVDVFLLFDDTGSFVNNSPIVRSAFPDIIAQLQASLPGIDLGFGVGRFEEYGNFAYEYNTGRPFILNQPIVAASTSGYMTAIQAALNRTTPGYGGDLPETDIEALYQLVTGLGFDGNNNGSVLDSGAAGFVATQLTPGTSGDVPSFASFRADPSGNVLSPAGNVGGGGFRVGALPILLVATDTGFAYQPKGETTISGVGGVSLPVSALTGTSRSTTPYNLGAGLQQTVTGLNALGALVIGLGTNPQANIDPRQGLESLSKLTGAVNKSTTTITNGTPDAIAPGDPLYFQIASGFSGSVANGVVSAIQNAVTNVAVDITLKASDPRVKIVNRTGVQAGIGSGQTATFNIEFVGDGVPRRFDLQFVRNGTDVVLGSIPVVLGTPISGDCYEFEDLDEGEISDHVDFGSRFVASTPTAPTFTIPNATFTYDGSTHTATATATGNGGVVVAGTVAFTYNGSNLKPTEAGTYVVVATFTSADPNYLNATATGELIINKATPVMSDLNTPVITQGTPSTTITGHLAAGGTVPVGDNVVITLNGEPHAASVDASGNFTLTLPTATLAVGRYLLTVTYAGDGINFNASVEAHSILSVSALPTITATGLNVAAIAGAPAAPYVATFVNVNASSKAQSYTGVISWGDGTTSVGVITSTQKRLLVAGKHTYANPGVYTVHVTISATDGMATAARTTSLATVQSSNRNAYRAKPVEFWNSSKGQLLLLRFNGGTTHTELATWLATNFPNMYGHSAGRNDLTGKTNNEVAALFQRLWSAGGDWGYTQVLATALNVYATTSSLGGIQGVKFGFSLSVAGLGARLFNVKGSGAVVSVPNNTSLNVFQMLRAVDTLTVNGNFYNGDGALLTLAKSLFDELNSI